MIQFKWAPSIVIMCITFLLSIINTVLYTYQHYLLNNAKTKVHGFFLLQAKQIIQSLQQISSGAALAKEYRV